MADLVRWLGPFGDPERAPDDVDLQVRTLPPNTTYDRPLQVHCYKPSRRAALGSLIVVHGLHPLGPNDERLARFLRRLAASGISVWAPALNEYMALRLDEGVIAGLARTMEAFAEWPDRPRTKIGVFSISFGSLPTLRLAANPAFADVLGGVVLYGGYGDFVATMRFALGADGRPRDLLNPPAIFINLGREMDGAPPTDALEIAWRDFTLRTWERPEMKDPSRMRVVVDELAQRFTGAEREFFLLGCGIGDGGLARAEAAIAKVAARYHYLDPRPHLTRVRCPVTIVHGVDDDVIPHEQATLIRAALQPHTRVQMYLTGLYGHTGAAKPGPRALAKEAAALLGMMRALVATATQPARGPSNCPRTGAPNQR